MTASKPNLTACWRIGARAFAVLAAVWILAAPFRAPAAGARAKLDAEESLALRTRAWRGTADLSAEVDVTVENDQLAVTARISDDLGAQPFEDASRIALADHVEIWLRFGKSKEIQLLLSPGQTSGASPVAAFRPANGRLELLSSTPPEAVRQDTGYRLEARIPLADLRIDPDDKPTAWGCVVGDRDFPPAGVLDLLRDYEERSRYFIGRCHDAGLRVMHLENVEPGQKRETLSRLLRYQTGVKPKQWYDGIVFDLGAATPTDTQLNAVTEAVRQWRRQFSGSSICIAADWKIGDKPNKALGQKAYELADRIWLRGCGATTASFQAALQANLPLASKAQKPFRLVIETAPSTGPTFAGQTVAHTVQVLREVEQKIGAAEWFEGWAIDDYRHLRRMQVLRGKEAPLSKPIALLLRCNGGLAEHVVANDYFQRDFFKRCQEPLGNRKNPVATVALDAGEFIRGPRTVELEMRFPAGFDPAQPGTWAPLDR